MKSTLDDIDYPGELEGILLCLVTLPAQYGI